MEAQLVCLSTSVSLSKGLKDIPHPLNAVRTWESKVFYFLLPELGSCAKVNRSLRKLCSHQALYLIQYDFKSEFVHWLWS